VMPIMTLLLINKIAMFLLSQMPGSLYAFSLDYSISKAATVIFAVMYFAQFFFALDYFTRPDKVRWQLISIRTIWIIAIIMNIINYMSYGHIEETGISYKSINTAFQTEKIVWAQVDEAASLDISYHWMSTSGGDYMCVLKIPTKSSQSSKEFYIRFRYAAEHKSLPMVLKILQRNKIHVDTVFQDDALKKMASDPEKADILKDIKALTEVK